MPNPANKTASADNERLQAMLFQNIARQIKDGACVLFLGPAALSAKQADGTYRPLMELCANTLASNLNLPAEEADSLTQVASTLRMGNQLSDTMIIAAVQDFYQKAEKEAELNPLLEKLADLPFRIVVNATPDDFFARYYAQTVRDFRFDHYNFRKPTPDPLYSFGDGEPPLIYNLFGFYKKPESMVITYNDQLGYVNKITGAQHERLPDSLLAAFNVPRFYLFLGFDFEDWSLRVLLDALFKNARNSIQPFAYPLKGEPKPGAPAKVFFQGEFKMEFPDADMESFVDQVLEYYNALDSNAEHDSDANTKATVLILHSEAGDDPACQALIKHLRPLGLKVKTLKDAAGEGDVQHWIQETLNTCQIVLPLLSADFFADDNPALPLMDDIAARNNPRNRFLVMPVLLQPVSVEGTSLGALRTLRPLNKQAVFGENQENKHFADIADTLKKYVESIS